MNEIFMGQFFVIFNFLFIFLLQTGRFLLGSMHVALDFQILTGNYLRLIHFIIEARAFFFEEMERLNDLKVCTVELGDKELFGHPKIVP